MFGGIVPNVSVRVEVTRNGLTVGRNRWSNPSVTRTFGGVWRLQACLFLYLRQGMSVVLVWFWWRAWGSVPFAGTGRCNLADDGPQARQTWSERTITTPSRDPNKDWFWRYFGGTLSTSALFSSILSLNLGQSTIHHVNSVSFNFTCRYTHLIKCR